MTSCSSSVQSFVTGSFNLSNISRDRSLGLGKENSLHNLEEVTGSTAPLWQQIAYHRTRSTSKAHPRSLDT
ncbi:hypothetical protein [Nostoc piscinale]|uniref:hypothetical protein n=1 Tax=Nostoc piscinale TaxID=224012 RepID=UPI0011876533|nr:hypothetical protein [Nostoc piscinale]